MNHVIAKPNGPDLGFGCPCGNRFDTQKLADKHAEDSNLLEENAAKAEAAKMEDSADRVAPGGETSDAPNAEQPATAKQSQPTPAAEQPPAPPAPTEAPQAAVSAPPAPEPPIGPMRMRSKA